MIYIIAAGGVVEYGMTEEGRTAGFVVEDVREQVVSNGRGGRTGRVRLLNRQQGVVTQTGGE